MHQPHIDIFHDYKKKKKELQMEGRNNLNVLRLICEHSLHTEAEKLQVWGHPAQFNQALP